MSTVQIADDHNDQKVSQYAHVFRYPDGLTLAYNSLSGNLISLGGEAGCRVASALNEKRVPDQEGSAYYQELTDGSFLVEKDINELNVVKEIWRKGQRKQSDVMLTILPTLSCNFECPYCFERHTKGLMAIAVQDALAAFSSQFLLPKSNSVSIDWFGGEPLIGLSVIERVSKRFLDLCIANGLANPVGSITTNGYLLNEDMYGTLMELGITSAQITLDGPPKIHNLRRPLVAGKPTFDRIIQNILCVPETFSLSVRINVDSGNCQHIFELVEILHNAGVIPRVSVYAGMVESFSEECRSSAGAFLTPQEFALFKSDLNRRCESVGIPWMCRETPRLTAYGYCIVDQPKGFVVQPDGKLLKCWAEAGNATARPVADLLQENTWAPLFAKRTNHRRGVPVNTGRRDGARSDFVPIGNLLEGSSATGSDIVRPVSPLQSRDPFDDEECCQCSLLPVCMGGCPTVRESERRLGQKRCPPLRYSLPEEVRNLYMLRTASVGNALQTRRLQSI